MEKKRVINSLRNMSWGMVFKLVVLVFSFLNKTVIIRSIGVEYAGVANLFTSIMSVLNMAELGLNSAILFSMYNSIALKDRRRTNALLNFYRKAYLIIGTIILLIGLLLCVKIDYFIAGDYPSDLNIYIVFLIFLANTVSSYIFFAYYSVVLSANQREDITYRNNMIVHLCAQAIQFIVLIVLKDYYIYILVALVATVLYNYLNYKSARRKYPEYICEGKITKDERKLLKKQITGLMIGKLSVISRNSFDSIVISSVLGLTATAIYGNYYYIMFSVFGLIFFFCSGMKASIGNKIATCSAEENYADLLEFSFIFYIIYGICTAILICLYQPFMRMWVGNEYTSTFLLALLMCIYFFFFCSTGIVSQYWEAAGLFWENRFRYILEAVLNLIFDIVLVRIWGLYGVILATIITMVFSANILGPVILFRYYFRGYSLKRYFLQQVKYFMCTLVAGSVSYYICLFVKVDNIMGLFIRLLISGFVSAVIILFLSFKSKECQSLVLRYGSLIGIRGDHARKSMKKIIHSTLFILCIVIVTIGIILTVLNYVGGGIELSM